MKNLLISLLLITNSVFAAEDIDPFENINRSVYDFNETIDDNILEPVAKSYQKNMPEVAQDGVSNFFGNLGDVTTLANQILQFKPIESVETLGRVLINTTIGLGGLFDVASELGLTTDDEDFGQTMAMWGVEQGAYIVLPILGPSTTRDSAGSYVDLTSDANFINQTHGVGLVAAGSLSAIDKRVELLSVTDLIGQSDDPYIAMRSSYLQKRKFDVFDGNLPTTEADEF